MINCQYCKYRKDLNKIIPWLDPSQMVYNWKCFYNISDNFNDVILMYNNNECKHIPDLRYDLYHHKWITMNFLCPLLSLPTASITDKDSLVQELIKINNKGIEETAPPVTGGLFE